MLWYWVLILIWTLGMPLNSSKLYLSHWWKGGNLLRKDSARPDRSSMMKASACLSVLPWAHSAIATLAWTQYIHAYLQAFARVAPSTWEVLLPGFPMTGSLLSFRSELKHHLLREALLSNCFTFFTALARSDIILLQYSFPWLLSVRPTSVNSRSTGDLSYSLLDHKYTEHSLA